MQQNHLNTEFVYTHTELASSSVSWSRILPPQPLKKPQFWGFFLFCPVWKTAFFAVWRQNYDSLKSRLWVWSNRHSAFSMNMHAHSGTDI